LGERLRARASASTATDARAAPFPNAPAMSLPLDRTVQPDCAWKEDVQRAATKETEKALKVQEESRRSLVSVRANPAAAAREALGPQRLCSTTCEHSSRRPLQARERLGAERTQGQRVELQAQLEARCTGPREQTEGETRLAAGGAEGGVGAGERAGDEGHKRTDGGGVGLQQLQGTLVQVSRERMWYETEFKKVQASYRQFVDLTDTSLHSDYLLKLRCLGREPGLMENTTQTDVSHIPTIP
ncbi:hypothetical protein P4O66_008583, partial [Electrophorus voltai]